MHRFMALACMLLLLQPSGSLVLLSDLKTPALVIDVDRVGAAQKGDIPVLTIAEGDDTGSHFRLCPMPLPNHGQVLSNRRTAESATPIPLAPNNQDGNVFWHTSVLQGRECSKDKDSNVLARVDIPHGQEAQLVLGWNNHHVISYYWARSAGAGAAMEAPGIVYQEATSTLQWASNQGPMDCNSNDGKRSEWVNFLRPRDQVQLLPPRPETLFRNWAQQQETIYGISSYQRPMGSEPQVICQFVVEE